MVSGYLVKPWKLWNFTWRTSTLHYIISLWGFHKKKKMWMWRREAVIEDHHFIKCVYLSVANHLVKLRSPWLLESQSCLLLRMFIVNCQKVVCVPLSASAITRQKDKTEDTEQCVMVQNPGWWAYWCWWQGNKACFCVICFSGVCSQGHVTYTLVASQHLSCRTVQVFQCLPIWKIQLVILYPFVHSCHDWVASWFHNLSQRDHFWMWIYTLCHP